MIRKRVAALLAALLSLIPVLPATAALPDQTLPTRSGLPTLAPVLQDVTPAVVNISVQSRSQESDNPLLRDPFFRRFFNLPDKPRPQTSAGSGVIVDAAKGYVLTNHHVVKNAESVVVTLKDRRNLEAKVLGSDAGTDIALLQVEAEKLTAIRLGDSDQLEVGDFVVAIGNPFGLGQTVTSGIVSALGRSGLNIEGFEDFIQTDASINPGNSGGALVNLKGELVGINTAIIGPTGGNVGIGFAVPVNMVKAVVAQLVRFGEVRRGHLGLAMQDVTPDLAKALTLPSADGAVLTEVSPESPADKAGLQAGDVVLAVNGRPVRGSADLRVQLGLVPVGEDVDFRILRDGKPRQVKARVGAPEETAESKGAPVPELAGAAVSDVQSRNRRASSVVVVQVERGSPAYRHGVRRGDIIVGVNNRRVGTVKELIATLRGVQGALALNVLRGESRLLIVIR